MTRRTSAAQRRVAALRARMRDHGVDAYLIPSTDPHQSEYVPECWQRRAYLSGFTGSAGDVVVTARDAGLWTDGRYYLQAHSQLRGSGIRLFKAAEPETPTKAAWLAQVLGEGGTLGVDPRLLSPSELADYERVLGEVGARVVTLDANLVDAIWDEQPPLPAAPIMALPKRFTGVTAAAKLRDLRKAMSEMGTEAHVLTTLDSIAWLFNIRGTDVPYNPVAIAYAIVTGDAATLFIDPRKVPEAVRRALGAQVTLAPYTAMGGALRKLAKERRSVLVDPASASAWIVARLRGAKVVRKTSPVPAMKARKNDTEVAGMRAAHVRDGVAMVRFLSWLDDALGRGGVTELTAAAQLERLRSEGENFRGLSFGTISGYADHGAIIHYSADEATDVPLRREGLYLLDSGAQYLDGTTDITRTVLLGKRPSPEQSDRFTRVLKGHIRLARAVFPKGVTGMRLDTLARSSLWDGGFDYGHGTGHGVGAYLNVHEGPQSISVRPGAPLEPGNILSNEPGYYEPGEYGIRIENLVLVTEAEVGNGRPFYRFETLTQCPIDTRLVDRDLLDDGERAWLNEYHGSVYRTLAPHLAASETRWLREATRAI